MDLGCCLRLMTLYLTLTYERLSNLVNWRDLQEEMKTLYHFNTNSDTEVLLVIIADEIFGTPGHKKPKAGISSNDRINPQAVFEAICALMSRAQGGYATLLQLTGKGLVAFRDPYGIRPLCYGRRPSKSGWDYMVASESIALYGCGFDLVRDFRPGEAMWFGLDGSVFTTMCSDNKVFTPCLFEYVYFARPDSVIDGVSVYRSRQLMGKSLAKKFARDYPDVVKTIDVVCPVPDTSRVSAVHFALTLGIHYEEGLCKNRYIARTFIMPGQAKRRASVRKKLSPIMDVLSGKNVLLIDDSIVRGTTSSEIIQMCRDAGAEKVIFCSAAPPIRYPNVYGIDIPVQNELVAYGRTEKDISDKLGADLVVYGDTNDVVNSVTSLTNAFTDMDTSCFTGTYTTGNVDTELFERLNKERSDQSLINEMEHVDIMDGGAKHSNTNGTAALNSQDRIPSYTRTSSGPIIEDVEYEHGLDSVVVVNAEDTLPPRPQVSKGRKIASMNSDYQNVADTLSGW